MKLVNLTNGNSKSVFTENMSLSEKFKIEQKNFMTEFFEKFITISHHMNYFIPREEIFEYLSEYGILTNRFPPERLMIINFFKKKQILSERKCMNGTYIYLWPYIQWTRDEESGQKIIDRVLNTEGDSNDSKTAQ